MLGAARREAPPGFIESPKVVRLSAKGPAKPGL